MSKHLELETVCPNNHNQTVRLSKDQFEAALTAGTLEFHCNTCDTSWPPTKEEIGNLRKGFEG
ncbi:MAG: hypothetical protein JO336_13855 [Acidobacteriia bacterium]|nr:hypothetical protein [Terriglobia bacterium]MBV9746455.1 hypothetical protein [Terriglobia bacterium]